VDFVVGVRSHTGDVLSVYLMDADMEKLPEFLTRNTIRSIAEQYEADRTKLTCPLNGRRRCPSA
jgi:hypothetical protein